MIAHPYSAPRARLLSRTSTRSTVNLDPFAIILVVFVVWPYDSLGVFAWAALQFGLTTTSACMRLLLRKRRVGMSRQTVRKLEALDTLGWVALPLVISTQDKLVVGFVALAVLHRLLMAAHRVALTARFEAR